MAGDPRTRDPKEPLPIIPDKRYDETKPINYDVEEGLRYIDSSCCGECLCEEEPPVLDLDPFDDVEGYYSEGGNCHEDIPVMLASDKDLQWSLHALKEEYQQATSAFQSACKRASLDVPVLRSFNTMRAWGTLMSDMEWRSLVKSASLRKFEDSKQATFLDRLDQLYRRRVAAVLVCHKEGSLACDRNPQRCQIRKAVRDESWSDLQKSLQGSSDSLEIQRVAWVVKEFGPQSRYFEGSKDLFRKLRAWALPELRLVDGE